MSKRFRKAVDANAMVILAAVGVIVLIGMYYLSKNTLSSVGDSQSNMGTAMEQGLADLQR